MLLKYFIVDFLVLRSEKLLYYIQKNLAMHALLNARFILLILILNSLVVLFLYHN